MDHKALTFLEVIAVVIIIAIIVTVALPVFSNFIEDAKTRVCVTNVKTLRTAVEVYIMEHDVVPGSLSQLEPSGIETAYAAVMKERGAWKVKVAQAIVGLSRRNSAFAQGPSFGLPVLHCPKDTRGGISYGLNQAVIDTHTSIGYKNLKDSPGTKLMIADSDNAVCSNGPGLVTYASRLHIHINGLQRVSFLVGISMDGKVGISIANPASPDYNSNFYFNPGVIREYLGGQQPW
ncbi:MAG: hypothetical protein PHT59_03700 [Candidatus Omnitrophica bacterium]|nr:hypothetical protein [Candidatus Omnitrophota bacterium]